MNFRDFIGMKNKNQLEVLEVKNVHGDYYTVKLKLNDSVMWRPGEHGIFTLPDYKFKGKKWRAFSVASIKDEGYMLIGTRIGENISAFKKALIAMKPGEKVKVMGPFGWFTEQDKTSPIVFIPSGVGITPVRALLKQLEEDKARPVEIIYSAKDYYLFLDDIKDIVKNNDMITLHQVSGKEEAQQKAKEAISKYGNSAYYYISGSIDIIKSNSKFIKSNGIKGKRLISDPFLGY